MFKEVEENLLLNSSKFLNQKDYWINKLSGEIPETKMLIPKTNNYPFGEHKRNRERTAIPLPDQLCRQIINLAKNSDLSIYIVLLAGLKLLIYRYMHSKDIVVVSPLFNPNISDDTLNSYLFIRDLIRTDLTFKQLLIKIRQSLLEAYENQDYPIHRLIEYLFDEEGANAHGTLSNIVCLLTNIHDERDISEIKDKLLFSFTRENERIKGDIVCDGNIYDNYYVKQLAQHLMAILENSLQDINAVIPDISFLTKQEKEQLIHEFSHSKKEYPYDLAIHQLFAQQVMKTPDRLALVFEDIEFASQWKMGANQTFTYGKLNEMANRLASVLKAKGVGPGSIIGLMVEPSIEMIVGMLGILKAGGALLPLDPTLPRKRIITMLEDCGTLILLTRSNELKNSSFSALQNLKSIKMEPLLTVPRPQITNLDGLPMVDRSLINYEKYHQYVCGSGGMAKHTFSLMATRGCLYKCAFCHKLWPKSHWVRSAENILEEIRFYYNMGVRRFAFIDDTFNLNIKNSTRFFELIIKSGLEVQLFFSNGMRGDILTRDYIDLMLEAGTVHLLIALETASPRLQKMIRKNLNLDKFEENLEYIIKKYPQVILEMEMMIGFPTETQEEARMTLDFLKRQKWIHFPNLHILKVYPNTDMFKIALENGISEEQIERSTHLAYHELPETLRFPKGFVRQCQADFLNKYFLSKERFLHVLPYQMELLTEDEIVQKYDNYLPATINSFEDLLNFVGITREELRVKDCKKESCGYVPDIDAVIKKHFPVKKPVEQALRIMLLDLSQFFSYETDMLYDVIEPPLGLMYLLTYLNRQFGTKIHGKIAKSRTDFDNYGELKAQLEEFRPQVIGIRTLSLNKNFFHQTVALIRQWGFQVPIIAGGPYATSEYATILQDPHVDLVVMSEGEITFSEVIGKMMENEGKLPGETVLEEIAGIAFIPGKKDRKGESAREIILLDSPYKISSKASALNIEPINPCLQPDEPAYVIFTSGSTGKPKAVPISHHNVIPLLLWDRDFFGLGENTRVIHNLSFAFDYGLEEIFTTLMYGGGLYFFGREKLTYLREFVNFINYHEINTIHTTPAFFSQVISSGKKMPALTKVHFGGEKLTKKLITDVAGLAASNCTIYNGYGPTEVSINAAIFSSRLDNEYIANMEDHIPIGKPSANNNLYILNPNRHLLPVGVLGEICIGGVGVSDGYLNQPMLTAEQFINDPYRSGERLYLTGDLGRWLPNGNIEFLDRIDNQVKLRGYRIELGEIENRLSSHDCISEAIVAAGEDKQGDHYLCAYFIPTGNRNPDEPNGSELREYLSEELPHYMIPSYFVPIEKIPLTANGKVDKKALPDPEIKAGAEYVAPRSEIEEELAHIWSEVLGIEKEIISINTNFFELGGHSLKATILGAQIHKKFNAKITLIDLFKAPTIKGISENLQKQKLPEFKFSSIKPAVNKDYYALSSAQKRMYIVHQLEPTSINYNIPMVVMLVGKLDRDKLEGTSMKLIERHESLRTSFVMVAEEPMQKIHPNTELEFSVEYHETDEEKSKEILKDFIRPFELHKAPLLRIALIKVGDIRHILMVDMHHIISDGISLDIFKREFMTLYDGEELAELRLQYKDYSEWQNSAKEKEMIRKQRDYWLHEFAGEVPILNLPTDYQRPTVQSFEGSTLDFIVEEKETKAIKKIAKEEEATLFIVMLTIFYVFLAKLTGAEDIVVGTPTAGRKHADLQDILGMFVNMLALRNSPKGEKTFRAFLEEVKKRSLEAFDNQDFQFEDLIAQLVLNRDLGRNPLFDVIFEFNNMSAHTHTHTYTPTQTGKMNVPELELIPFEYENKIAKVDMNLSGLDTGEELHFTFEYCTKLFSPGTMEKMTKYLKNIIHEITVNPGKKISDIKMISDEEKRRLLKEIKQGSGHLPVNGNKENQEDAEDEGANFDF